MIRITGTTRQTFSFPADVATASRFYRDFSRILHYLPHIQLVKAYGPDQFRVMYHTLELSVYRVRIYCDLQVSYDEASQTLHVTPLLEQTTRQIRSHGSLAHGAGLISPANRSFGRAAITAWWIIGSVWKRGCPNRSA